jgi:hypothetical protein
MNVLIGFGVAICLFIIFFFSLGWITGNGETEKVPAVIGLDVAAAEKNLIALGFDVELQDSIYVDTLARNAVLRQTPEADEVVKKGSKGDAAKGVQVIINEIARWRGWSGQTKKASNGKYSPKSHIHPEELAPTIISLIIIDFIKTQGIIELAF